MRIVFRVVGALWLAGFVACTSGGASPGGSGGRTAGSGGSGGGAGDPSGSGGRANVTSTGGVPSSGGTGDTGSGGMGGLPATGGAGNTADAAITGTGGSPDGAVGATGGGAGNPADAGAPMDGGSGVDAPAASGDPFLGDVAPTKNGDLWRLTLGDVVFEVNATKGASVITYALAGHNVLADGSHFRPSPQKTWNWPPPAEIAQSAYTASMDGKIIVMESQTNAQWGVKAKKRFWANAANKVITIEYTLTNTSTGRASWAPWEVSRVNATGLTFFPEGTAIAAKPASFGTLLPLQAMAGVSWLDYKASSYTTGNYIVAHDGLEGWSAHAEAGVLFVKSFPDISAAQIPPEEGEIQLWTDATHTALEMENEGAYVAMNSGQSIVWVMHWTLRTIPSDITATVGNAKLVDLVRSGLLKN